MIKKWVIEMEKPGQPKVYVAERKGQPIFLLVPKHARKFMSEKQCLRFIEVSVTSKDPELIVRAVPYEKEPPTPWREPDDSPNLPA